MAAALGEFVIAERCEPETSADEVGIDCEVVFGTCFEETQQVLNDRSCCVVPFKVHEPLTIDRWGIDEGGFLSIVDQISGVDANERDAAILDRGCLHLKTKVVEVAQRLNKSFELPHRLLLNERHERPGLLESRDVIGDQRDGNLVHGGVIPKSPRM